MAGLADDWPENRQTRVDVLCAHLGLPYDPDPGDDAAPADRSAYRANREVRHTVIRVITAHLRADAAVSWQGLNFDFTGVVFDGGDFSGVRFSGGWVNFNRAEFSSGAVFFYRAEFSDSTVSFGGAVFSGGKVLFTDARFSGGEVDFSFAGFSGGEVVFDIARFSGGTVRFDSARFSGGRVNFDGARFSGGTVRFVTFSADDFVAFSADEMRIGLAVFSGGEVDFSGAMDWSSPPAFPWTDTPPGVKCQPQPEGTPPDGAPEHKASNRTAWASASDTFGDTGQKCPVRPKAVRSRAADVGFAM
jgi:hypothetical protein